jgi:hypothetical protein
MPQARLEVILLNSFIGLLDIKSQKVRRKCHRVNEEGEEEIQANNFWRGRSPPYFELVELAFTSRAGVSQVTSEHMW